MSILRREGALRVSRYTLKNVPLAIVTPKQPTTDGDGDETGFGCNPPIKFNNQPTDTTATFDPQYINFSQYRILRNEHKEIDKRNLNVKLMSIKWLIN